MPYMIGLVLSVAVAVFVYLSGRVGTRQARQRKGKAMPTM